MKQRLLNFLAIFFLLAGLLGEFHPAAAQNETPPAAAGMELIPLTVGLRPAEEGREAAGPGALTAAPDGRLYVTDTLDGKLWAVDAVSGESTALALPEGTTANDVVVQGQQVYVSDIRGDQILKLDETSGSLLESYPVDASLRGGRLEVSADGSKAGLIISHAPLGDVAAADVGQSLLFSSQRVDERRGKLTLPDGRELLVETEHYLGSAVYLSSDAAGNAYVLVEELLEDVPVLLVDAVIRRYSPQGELTGWAHVPLEAAAFIPQRYAAITAQGEAYFLQVKADSAALVRLPFSAGYQSNLAAQWEAIKDQVTAPAPAPEDADLSAQGSITRDQVLRNADAYLHVNWVLGAANYHNGPSNDWSGCQLADPWRLPRYLSGRLGQTIAEVPYNYSGYQSVDDFRARINRGDWAGDLCQEKYEQNTNIAGVDCSGYVSKVLGVGHYNVAGLKTIGKQIGWNQLRPGDYLTAGSNSHVVLFHSFANGADVSGGVNLYEANGSGYDRVIYRQRSYSEISGYATWHYNGISDDPTDPLLIRTFDAGFESTWVGSWVKIKGYGQSTLSCAASAEPIVTWTRRPGYTGDSSWARWRPTIATPGTYRVSVYMPNYNLDDGANVPTSQAHYAINHANGQTVVTLNQNAGKCGWVSLGIYPFNAGTAGNVYLGDYTGDSQWQVIAADAVKFEPVTSLPADATLPSGNVTAPTNGAVILSSPVNFTADAWDNAGGSGVKKVEFHIFYNGEWHLAGSDEAAPYSLQWDIPAGLTSQELIFTLHVTDNAGNESMDPGGYRRVNYQAPSLVPLAQQINTYLASKGSPLNGSGDSFNNWGLTYDVDPRLMVAIAGAESTFGRNGSCATQRHNAWGYGGGWPSCWTFNTWDDGIRKTTWQIQQYRNERGLTNIHAIGQTWCGSGCSSWEPNVRLFYAALGGNPDSNDLTYPDGLNRPVPVFDAMTPETAQTGSGDLSLTLTGSGFSASSQVRWNSATLVTTFVNDQQMIASVPADRLISAGTADVTVFTPAPGGGTSQSRTFTINTFPTSFSGWRGEYYNNETLQGDPALVRDDPQIDFAWQYGAPGPGVSADHFSVRWTRSVFFEYASDYTFHYSHDDGVRVWVDGAMAVEKWYYGGGTGDFTVNLTRGWHDLRMEIYEIDGWASAGLNWERGSITTGVCPAAHMLALGAVQKGSTLRSVNNNSFYPGQPWYESGPENAYTFTASSSGWVEFKLSGMTADLDLFVMDNGQGGCDPNRMIAYGDQAVSFHAYAGAYYTIVVDGYQGARSGYTLRSRSLEVMPTNNERSVSRRPVIAWPEISGTRYYRLQVSRAADFKKLEVNRVLTGAVYQMPKDLAPDATYYWRVQARRTDGKDQWIGPYSFDAPNPPAVPLLVAPANRVSEVPLQPHLEWKNPAQDWGIPVTFYEMQLATDPAFANVVQSATVGAWDGTGITLSQPLQLYTGYYWRVRAYESGGSFSAWSAPRYFRTVKVFSGKG